MVLEAHKFEKYLKASGQGAFGRIEYGANMVKLRISAAKEMPTSSTVRMYFDGKREQMMGGRLFSPMSDYRPFRFRPMIGYKVYTQMAFDKPVPKDTAVLVVSEEWMEDFGLIVVSSPMRVGYQGIVTFSVLSMRRVEIDEMIHVANLMFFSESGATDFPDEPPKRVRKKKKPEKTETDEVETDGASTLEVTVE